MMQTIGASGDSDDYLLQHLNVIVRKRRRNPRRECSLSQFSEFIIHNNSGRNFD